MKKIISAIVAAGIALSGTPAFAINSDSMAGIVSTESGRLNIRNSAGGYVITSVPKGSYLALAVLIIIGIMLTTGKSLFTAIFAFFGALSARKKVKEAKIKAKAENIREKEEYK